MQGRDRAVTVVMLLIAALVVGLAIAAFSFHKNSDALWQIVSQQCVPGQQQKGIPAPCEHVDISQGYVTFKDRNGPLQYLLMPIARITGIESPLMLNHQTANFFYYSWQQRDVMAKKRGAPVPDSAISLAINSEYGRTQNQLHIHISCLRPDVRQQLDRLAPALDEQWQSEKILNHVYLIRTLTREQLAQQSVFIRLAGEVSGAAGQMGKYGLALAMLPDGRLALMAIERNWLKLNRASAEEIQDHSCKIL